jgi:isopenicillin-N epimerase
MSLSSADLLPDDVWTALRREYAIRPGVTYLNNGSFGPPPRAVVDARRSYQADLDANPMDFFVRRWEPLLDEALAAVAKFVGTSAGNLTFVPNATYAMNVVAANVALAPGDEVLLNDHEYGAVFRIWERRCGQTGAKMTSAALPYPLKSAEEIVDAIFAAVTPRTRLIIVSHVTSPTAVVLPVAEICRRARLQDVAVCIDGPHAIAMCELDLDALDCDFYCVSGHKWLSAPFGSGFLYVHLRRQGTIDSIVRSWGKRSGTDVPDRWTDEFRWLGTNDPSAYLAIPAAIRFLESVGLDAFRRHTHALMREARGRIEALTRLPSIAPDDLAWYGSMAALPLPDGDGPMLQRRLWERHGIEILINHWNGRRHVRPSIHLYNTPDDVDRLVAALAQELAHERS